MVFRSSNIQSTKMILNVLKLKMAELFVRLHSAAVLILDLPQFLRLHRLATTETGPSGKFNKTRPTYSHFYVNFDANTIYFPTPCYQELRNNSLTTLKG